MEVSAVPVKQIIISGFGGQGIVAAGKTLIYAAMLDGMKVSLLPSYGPEMRGGFANCHVIISEESIASPIVSSPDLVIAMSLPALEKFEPRLKSGGSLIIDSYLIKRSNFRDDIDVHLVPATRMAIDAGNVKFANVIMLGVMMELIDCPGQESMGKAIMNMLTDDKKMLFDKEMEALRLGREYAAAHPVCTN